MIAIKPFKIAIPDSTLRAIRRRVQNYPWHEMPDDGGWDYGTNLDYMREFCAYWVNHFDWHKQQAALNEFAQWTAEVDGINLHFIHAIGSGPAPMPLLISHGWPGTVVEFMQIIKPLTHPQDYGGKIEDAFTVIAPSLPGFGFSSRPPRPYGPRKMAAIFNKLMVAVLGYKSYLAQGGDWGGAIASWLGFDHAGYCRAIHINILTMRHPDGAQTPAEKDWEAQFARDQLMEDGYRTQQATRPQTLSYAMMDSPVGIAAWMIEKFNTWSDTVGDDIESAHSKDTLLSNIMIYIATRTFNSASWIYYGRREEGGRLLSAAGEPVKVPTACAVFPKEMLAWPPRSYVERLYNVQQWTEMPRGGHFAALEEPELLVADLQAFARRLRAD